MKLFSQYYLALNRLFVADKFIVSKFNGMKKYFLFIAFIISIKSNSQIVIIEPGFERFVSFVQAVCEAKLWDPEQAPWCLHCLEEEEALGTKCVPSQTCRARRELFVQGGQAGS